MRPRMDKRDKTLGALGAPIALGKRAKKGWRLQSARISQDLQVVWHPPCTDFSGEKNRIWDSKCTIFPGTQKIGTQTAQLS